MDAPKVTDTKSVPGTESKTVAAVSEFLTAPRKKRKNYVIMALGQRFNQATSHLIERYVKASYKNLGLSRPKNIDELRRQFGRNISLLIVDDQFTDLDALCQLIKALKVKRRDETIPVLFLTKNSEKLIAEYRRHLLAFQEVDDFCSYQGLDDKQILGRIKTGIENKNRRKARRYNTLLDVSFYHLSLDKTLKGHITDISVHGASLKSQEIERFKVGDQLKISIPIANYLSAEQGEYLRVSAKVRRVFIAGSTAAISFEYLTTTTHYRLVDFVTAMLSAKLNLNQKTVVA